MSKNYLEAVQSADVLFDIPDTTPEQLVAIGYRAALADSAAMIESLRNHKALAWTGGGSSDRVAAARVKIITIRIMTEKLASVARKFEDRAKELKV